MQTVITRRPVPDDVNLPADIHPVLRRVYAARRVTSAAELDYSLAGLLPHHDLHGIDQAAALLASALAAGRRLLIVADFDADGATSCALAVRGLRAMGAADIHYVVPNRFEFGYGLSPDIVRVAAGYRPDILMTVDNGISSMEGVALARAMNMDVLITDHHLPGRSLPDATAIVNPNQAGDRFPSKSLAGVGVVFYLLIALRSRLREAGWFATRNISEPNLAALLDLVALGTVADVVPLDYNNRILVAQGLSRIRSGRCCPGILALLGVANRPVSAVTAQDLAYAVAPRLNAAGRLTDMAAGIECLLQDDEAAARRLAVQLDTLNRERRGIQEEMHGQALAQIDQLNFSAERRLPDGLCLFDECWHQGVVGILAARIRDKYHRPVIAFARDRAGMIKGSARSIRGVHIRDVLDTLAGRHPGLIDKFGGHAMAAGLSIRESDLEQFGALFDRLIGTAFAAEINADTLLSDGELNAADLDIALAEQIIGGGPWGKDFPEPVFDGEFKILSRRALAGRHLKFQLKYPGDDKILEAIAFDVIDEKPPPSRGSIRTLYRLDINEYGGRRALQLVLDHISPIDAASGDDT